MDEKRLNLIYLVAKEYYIDEKKQKEIAEKYNINRVQVSRYITEAKKRGMVSIKVLNPLEDSKLGIKEKLLSFFPDLNVQIAVTHKRKEGYDFESLANKAIEYLNESFLPNDKVGFGWGNTMYHIAKNFKTPNKYEDIIIVPLVGGSMKFENEFQTNNISFMIAEKFGGFNVPILAPFYVEDDLYPSFIKNSL
jgi:deoxyribonucleoside regulator